MSSLHFGKSFSHCVFELPLKNKLGICQATQSAIAQLKIEMFIKSCLCLYTLFTYIKYESLSWPYKQKSHNPRSTAFSCAFNPILKSGVSDAATNTLSPWYTVESSGKSKSTVCCHFLSDLFLMDDMMHI